MAAGAGTGRRARQRIPPGRGDRAGPPPVSALAIRDGKIAATAGPDGPLSPLSAVAGMTTRATPAGVLGPEHAITRQEALRLYTVAGARFLEGETAGALVPGAPADLAAYRADPFTCPGEQLAGLSPAVTVINGQLAYRGA
jgi:predicted amidohydrolase YtcJ